MYKIDESEDKEESSKITSHESFRILAADQTQSIPELDDFDVRKDMFDQILLYLLSGNEK